MRAKGYVADIVERRVVNFITKDYCGFADIIIFKGKDTVAIQTTTLSNLSTRLTKILREPRALQWLTGGTRRILIHGWSKHGPRGKRKLWTCNEREVTLDDFK